jgi:cell wall-associated NlpC family hydrolase
MSRHCLDNAAERAAVVAAARAWIGTPYHHAADVRGPRGGVDCAMLLVRVYCDLGLVQQFDPRPYTRDWMMHRSEERYLGFLLARSREVDEPLAGDIVLFKVGRCYAHGGIVTKAEPLTIVHAFASARYAVEDEIARSELSARLKSAKFASYWASSPLPLAGEGGRAAAG